MDTLILNAVPALEPVLEAGAQAYRVLGSGTNLTDTTYHAESSVSFSWYLSPRQHATETMVLNLLVVPLVAWLARRYRRTTVLPARPTDKMSWPVWIVDQMVHVLGAVCLGFTLWYKYEKEAFIFMLQPCHLSNVIMMILWVMPGAYTGKDGKVVQNGFANWLQSFNMDIWFGCVAALLMPDFRNTRLFIEKEMFIIQHALLVALPFYYMAVRRFTIFSDVVHIFQNYLIFALMHWDVFAVASIAWDRNVNYMVQPPKGYPKYGLWYRPVVTAQCLVATFAGRYIFTGLWGWLVTGKYPYGCGCARQGSTSKLGLGGKKTQ